MNISSSQPDRYNGIAVSLHWLIAFLIIVMLAGGKWMTALDLADPMRFYLTQWHKSIGISILLLSLFRLIWRLSHKPPPPLAHIPRWERFAAAVTHMMFYVLMLAAPITGWLLVSASPLNIPTLLFDAVPWPHVPGIQSSKSLESTMLNLHHLAVNVLLALLLLHVIAALRHHLVLQDQTFSRMSLRESNGQLVHGLPTIAVLLIVLATSLGLYNHFKSAAIPATISAGEVRFTAIVMEQDLVGRFQNAEVEARIDPDNLDAGVLNATVLTSTVEAADSQIEDTLKDKDWFDVENHPNARFESSAITRNDKGDIEVTGNLVVKDTVREITFPVEIIQEDGKKMLTGGFTINRLDFKIGALDQPDDGTAGFNVLVSFTFEL